MLLCGLYYTPALRRRLFEFAWLGDTLKLEWGCYEVWVGYYCACFGCETCSWFVLLFFYILGMSLASYRI